MGIPYNGISVCSSPDEHLGSLQFLVIMNKAAMNIHNQVFVWTYVFISSESIPRSKIVGAYSKCMFDFIRNYQAVFQSGCTISHSPQQIIRVLVALHSCQSLVYSVFNFSHSSACVVVSHCAFNLRFSSY